MSKVTLPQISAAAADGSVERVHLVFKTHLDIGFTDSASAVTKAYFERHIPRALALARKLREAGSRDRFIWTVGSWLIYEYLEQADRAHCGRMEAAIQLGDIAWHAWPFTTLTELLDPSLCRFALSLSGILDRRFGRRTIAAKMTDVPGHTRSLIPYFAAAGVRFLHVGVNQVSTPPDVPSVFRWFGPDDTEIVVAYTKGGYGDEVRVPGLNACLAIEHTGDNLGPPTEENVALAYSRYRKQYRGSDVYASTLDAFADELWENRGPLPCVTAEIGDTWIHGVGSDPQKISAFRALCRLREQWEKRACVSPVDPAYRSFSTHLLLVAEHTWGKDEKVHLPAEHTEPGALFTKDETYEAAAFAKALTSAKFQAYTSSWEEQRSYLQRAVKALEGSPLCREAHLALQQLDPVRPGRNGYRAVQDMNECLSLGRFLFKLDVDSGALTSLCDSADGRPTPGLAEVRVGLVSYQSFSAADYDRFRAQYMINMEQHFCPEWTHAAWAVPDYTKPGIEKAGAVSQWVHPSPLWVGTQLDSSGDRLLVELEMPAFVCGGAGAPPMITMEYFFPKDAPRIELTLQWFGRTACRLPEALWCSFLMPIDRPETWCLDKLGYPVNPLDVVSHGARALHAVGEGVSGETGGNAWVLETLDAPLVAPGRPRLLDHDNQQPGLAEGMHVNLYNNMWGTNFPMWSDEDARFRFVLRFSEPGSAC